MTEKTRVLLVTIGEDDEMYERGLDVIQSLKNGSAVDRPARITFANEHQLGEVFNERTYRLLRVIGQREPASIRETARFADRDVKNVHEELSTLETLGVIEFTEDGQAKRPIFPYDDLIISPLATDDSEMATVNS